MWLRVTDEAVDFYFGASSLLSFPSPPLPLIQLEVWESTVNFPSGVWGRVPATDTFWGYFEARECIWWQCFCSFSWDKVVVIGVKN